MASWRKGSGCAGGDDSAAGKSPSSRARQIAFGIATALVAVVCFAGVADVAGWVGELISALGWRVATLGLCVALVQVVLGGRVHALISGLCSVGLVVLPLALSPRAARAGQGEHVTLLVVNAFSANQETDRLIQWLRAADADVVVVTEPPPRLVGALKPTGALADKFPFVARQRPVRAVHSWQIVASRFELDPTESKTPGLQRTVVKAGAARFTLIATHLTSPRTPDRFDAETADTQQLLTETSEAQTAGLSVVIAGDFNCPPTSHRARAIASRTGMRRAKPRWRLEGSWPASLPAAVGLPIDGAFVSHEVAVSDWSIMRIVGSDHRAIRMELVIPEAAGEAAGSLNIRSTEP